MSTDNESVMRHIDPPDTILSLRARIAELEAENRELKQADSWVPVGEQLPDDCGEPTLFISDGYVQLGYYQHSQEWATDGGYCRTNVTHWRPLPPAPEATP